MNGILPLYPVESSISEHKYYSIVLSTVPHHIEMELNNRKHKCAAGKRLFPEAVSYTVNLIAVQNQIELQVCET